jgi:hypothetical protein
LKYELGTAQLVVVEVILDSLYVSAGRILPLGIVPGVFTGKRGGIEEDVCCVLDVLSI